MTEQTESITTETIEDKASLAERAKLLNDNEKVKKAFLIALLSSIALLAVSIVGLIVTLVNADAFGGAHDNMQTICLWTTIIFGVTLIFSAVRRQSITFGLWFKDLWVRLEKRFPTLFEFIRYWLIANVTTIVDYILTFLMLWVFFASLQETPFEWKIGNFTVFKYAAGKGMGLAAFLAYVISFLGSNVYGFIAQRKIAFKANNNIWFSAIAFSIATIIILFITQFLPQFYMEWLYGIVGAGLGSVLIKFINCCISLWAMYPVNKFIIMRKAPSEAKDAPKSDD